MATQTVEFRYYTGLKRPMFRNAVLRGSWDAAGRFAAFWLVDTPMEEVVGEDGCPMFRASLALDLADSGTAPSAGASRSTARRAATSGGFRPKSPTAVDGAIPRVPAHWRVVAGRALLLHARPAPRRQQALPRAGAALRAALRRLGAERAQRGRGLRQSRERLHRRRRHRHRPGGAGRDLAAAGRRHLGERAARRASTRSRAGPTCTGSSTRRATRSSARDIFSRHQIGKRHHRPRRARRSLARHAGHARRHGELQRGHRSRTWCAATFAPTPPDAAGRLIPDEEFWATEFTAGLPVPTDVEDLVIYELHVGSLGFGKPGPGNLADAIALPRLPGRARRQRRRAAADGRVLRQR